MAREFDPNNPFKEKAPPGYPVDYIETFDAPGRLDKVMRFDAEKLEQVIALPGVQKQVKTAAERRLKKLREAR